MTINRGDKVVLPRGTKVHAHGNSKQPGRDYHTVRRQTVTVHHTLPGYTLRILHMSDKDRSYHPSHKDEYAKFDELILDARTNTDNEEAHRLYSEAYEMKIVAEAPSIRWGGKDGWCSAAIADVEIAS